MQSLEDVIREVLWVQISKMRVWQMNMRSWLYIRFWRRYVSEVDPILPNSALLCLGLQIRSSWDTVRLFCFRHFLALGAGLFFVTSPARIISLTFSEIPFWGRSVRWDAACWFAGANPHLKPYLLVFPPPSKNSTHLSSREVFPSPSIKLRS